MNHLETHVLRGAVAAHWRSRRFRLWLALLVAAAGVMAFVPLFHVLGFGFSFVMAILVSLASLDLGAAFVRTARTLAEAEYPQADHSVDRAAMRSAMRSDRLLARLIGRASLLSLSLLIPPLFLITLNALRVRNCDWWFGVEAFVCLPGLSAVLATILGVLIGLGCGARRRLSNILPFVVFLAAVAWAVWRFYAAPPVFSYSVFGGYFPGNLYDESIALRAPFFWARLGHVLTILALAAGAAVFLDVLALRLAWRPVASHRGRVMAGLAAMLLGAGAGAVAARAGELGFALDAGDIAAHLGGRYETEHFIIHYPRGGEIERDIAFIAEDHEFRYAQVVRALGAAPAGRITSFYFASAEDKFRMMGARNVYMAKPWRHEIYMHHMSFPHDVVRHEIAHVIAAAFGSPIFKVSAGSMLGLPLVFNVGLIEGIAVAADWPDHFTRELTPHESVKAMLELGMAPPVDEVLSTGFLAFSSARSYTLAGSFVRYLLDTHGAERLRALYRTGGDFQHAYGRPQAALVAEWRAMIDAIKLPPGTAEQVRERFRRPGIFSRPCPDAIARERERMAELAVRGDFASAVRLAQEICREAPGEPLYVLDLASMLVRAGQAEEAERIYRDMADDAQGLSSSLRAQALGELAAMAARLGDYVRVVALLREAAELPLGEAERRYVDAQLFAATHAGPAGPALRAYFWQHDPRFGVDPLVLLGRAAEAVRAEPGLGMGHYLLGRNMHGRGAPRDAMASLARALDLGLPSSRLEREAARLLAEAAYMAGELAEVEHAAELLMRPGQPEVIRLLGADWLERLHWKRTGVLP